MSSKRRWLMAWVAVMAGCALMLASPAMAAQDTIVGTVQAGYRIVTAEGDVYDVTNNDQGKKLMELVGKKVEARGKVSEDDIMKVITVIEYSVLPD
ncbi:MAG: hypothetical protein ABIL58_24690 [Pseudomonadota bacterium]